MNYAGYARILQRHGLHSTRLQHSSSITAAPIRQATRGELGIEESFPTNYEPDDTDFDHLVFALKYDGLDLAALIRIFTHIDRQDFSARIRAQPTSKYARRLFFLFERLTGEQLDLPDTPAVGYVGVLDPDEYYTAKGERLPRYRIDDNLLGEIGGFCPVVRRTPTLEHFVARQLDLRARAALQTIDPSLLARAINFLYTKETRSSFAIEHEEPSKREERFVDQLARVATLDVESEAGLTELQHAIVGARPLRDEGFRKPGSLEVYVSQTIGYAREKIHHVGTRSVSTPSLMQAWAKMRPVEGPGAAVIEAACKAFGFVFIHPFGDGNGRIHRLLFHHVLARRAFMPGNLIVPISSAILGDMDRYDQVLEDFSRRVLPLVDYTLDEDGRMQILNDPDDFYRYPDLTLQSEATFAWLERAIEYDLVHELDFLKRHDMVRERMRRIVDIPDRKEKLFIVLVLGNRGKLSKNKREQFAELSDDEVARLESVVQDGFEGFEGPLS